MATPIIKVKCGDQWVPMHTLPEQDQELIKQRAKLVLRQALEQQIWIMSESKVR